MKKELPNKTQKKTDSAEPARRSAKTPHVMKLVADNSQSENPVILAGKSRVPAPLRGREPLTRIMRGASAECAGVSDESVVVNITELAIQYEAPEILDRFNACSCARCVEFFSGIIAAKLPAQYARISKDAMRRGSVELTERIEPARKKVISQMIRELIGNKKRCFHDE